MNSQNGATIRTWRACSADSHATFAQDSFSFPSRRHQSNRREPVRLGIGRRERVDACRERLRGPRSARTVIFLSRIIKPRRFYPAGYCLSCKYYQNTSRRVARVQPPSPLRVHRMCAARGGRASDIRVAKLSGFHLAARPDWTDRHCQRVTLAASSSSALRTRHAHSRGLTGIIRRYYLREGSHARIAAALPGRVSCFNPRSCLPAFRSPFCRVPSFYGEAPSRLGQNWEIT